MGSVLQKTWEEPQDIDVDDGDDDLLPVPYDEDDAAFIDAVRDGDFSYFSDDADDVFSTDTDWKSMKERAEETCFHNLHATVTDVQFKDVDRRSEIIQRLGDLDETGDTDGIRGQLLDRYENGFPTTMTFRVAVDEAAQANHVPGQYFRVTYSDYEPRVYSVASSPNEDYLEFCVRRVPGGHLTEPLFAELSEGDKLFLRGPYTDDLLLNDPSERDIAFLATGTGAAPFKSMIDYLFEEGLDEYNGEKRNIWLFLGSTYEDTLPYREEFRELAEAYDNFYPVLTVSRETGLNPEYDGPTDYIQNEFVKYLDFDGSSVSQTDLPDELQVYAGQDPAEYDARIDPDNLEVYACGISAIQRSTKPLQDALGIELQEELFG